MHKGNVRSLNKFLYHFFLFPAAILKTHEKIHNEIKRNLTMCESSSERVAL